MGDFLVSAGIAAIIAALLVYAMYCVGLSLVLARLGQPRWKGYVPGLNYYTLITTLGFPGRWFGLAIIPYFGSVYVVAIALRLGKAFHRGRAWSATWLTVGAALGMFVIAREARPVDRALLRQKPSLRLPKLRHKTA